MCSACKVMDNSLRSMQSRWVARENAGEQSKHTPYAAMTREELLAVARNGAGKLKRLHEEVKRLRQKQDEMATLSSADNSNLSGIFSKLQGGVEQLQHRLQHPKRQWLD